MSKKEEIYELTEEQKIIAWTMNSNRIVLKSESKAADKLMWLYLSKVLGIDTEDGYTYDAANGRVTKK